MILSFLIGIVLGFFLSVPPVGPTNFAIMAKAFKQEIKGAVAIGAGAGAIDMVYILIGYGGVSALLLIIPQFVTNFFITNEHLLKIFLTFTGCVVVVLYGLKIMRMKIIPENAQSDAVKKKLSFAEQKAQSSVDRLHKTETNIQRILHHNKLQREKEDSNIPGSFFTGVFLCLSSITLPAAWFGIVTYLKGYGLINSNFWSGFLLSIGVLIGTTSWFYVLTKFISKNSHKISPQALSKINITVGIILLALGAFLLYKVFDFAFS